MSTEMTPSGVTGEAQPTASPTDPSAASTQTEDAAAGVAQTQTTEQKPPQESVGLSNLRGHVKNLETDLGKYKSEVERYKSELEIVEKRGGIEAAQPAFDLYDSMSVINPSEFDASGVLEKMWDAHPDNAWRTLIHAADNIPELREYVLTKYAQGQGAAAQAPERSFQEPQTPAQQEAPFYDETDPVQVAWKKRVDLLDAELKQLKADSQSAKQIQERTQAEQTKITHAQRIEEHVDGKLRPILQSAVDGLQGWDQQDIERMMGDVRVNLEKNPTYLQLYADAQNAAKMGAKGSLLKIMPTLRDVISHQIKSSVKYFSNRLGISPQKTVAAQTTRREITNAGTATAGQPVEKQYKSHAINDPDFVRDLKADIEAQFGGRR